MSLHGDLERLMAISLHDMPVTSLAIDFENRLLTLQLAVYNEETGDYDALILIFQSIGRLSLGELVLSDKAFEDLEVYGHTISYAGEECAIHLLLLAGFGCPSVELSFTFKQVHLT